MKHEARGEPNSFKFRLLITNFSKMLPGRFELPFAASETAALSIELRERDKIYRLVTSFIGSMRKLLKNRTLTPSNNT